MGDAACAKLIGTLALGLAHTGGHVLGALADLSDHRAHQTMDDQSYAGRGFERLRLLP